MSPTEFKSLDDAFLYGARSLKGLGKDVAPVYDATSPGSSFGTQERSTRELLGFSFSLSEPRARLLSPLIRRINLPFAIANSIWTLKGSRDLDMIAFYNAKGLHFSRDGRQIEAAFGSRLFGESRQIFEVERRLKSDTTTRRAFGVIYDVSDTLIDRLDVPCAVGLQFLIRQGMLHCITMMRSQSAVMILPYDVFLFSMIQEVLSCRINVPIGSYWHFAGSFHYYHDEEETVSRVCKERDLDAPYVMQKVKAADDETLSEVFRVEEAIRVGLASDALEKLELRTLDLEIFWQQALGVLAVYALRKRGREPAKEGWQWLPLAYRDLLW